jgi:hypothetical protein
MIRCIAWLTLHVNPVMILKGNLSTSRRVSETQQCQSPSSQVLLSLLVKQKNLACLSSANPMVSTNFCGVARAGLYCMSLSKVGHTAFQPPLASGHSYDILGARMLWKPKEARILTNFIDQPV